MKKIIIKGDIQVREAIKTITSIPVDGSWSVTFKETNIRNLEQNAKMWAMLQDFSKQLVWHGFRLSREEWKDFFTAGLKKFKIVPDMNMSGFIAVGGHTSTMTLKEVAELIELMNAFGSEHNILFTSKDIENAGN